MSRRTVSVLLAACLLLGMLSGCGREAESIQEAGSFGSVPDSVSTAETVPDSSAEDASAEAPSTGSFSMPYNASYGWNPFTCTGMENRAVMELIYESLFNMNNEFEAEPMLCRAWEVSDDGLTYTLELESAVFSNGKSLTADDVVYSMQRAEESELYAGRFTDIASYYASGASTVIVELWDPNDRLPCLLTFPIVPSGSGGEAPPGTGPFVKNGDTLTLNGLWRQGADTLNFQTVNLYASVSAEDTRDNFEIDNVHFVYNDPSASSAATFHCDYELWNSRGTVMQYIGFNFTSAYFSDSAARAAITHAVNRVQIAETVYHNFADAAVLPVPPSSSLYDEELAQKYDYTSALEARNQLLETEAFYLPAAATTREDAEENTEDAEPAETAETADAADDTDTEDAQAPADGDAAEDGETEDGEDSEPVTYNNITMLVQDGNLSRVAAARQVAQNLEDVGFTVDVRLIDAGEFNYYLNQLDWDIYYGEVCLKPDFDLRSLLEPEGSLCYGAFSGSSELEALLYDAMENSGNRYDLYESIMEHGYLCPVLFINNAVFTTRGMFTGLDPSPDNLFYQITNIHVNHG